MCRHTHAFDPLGLGTDTTLDSAGQSQSAERPGQGRPSATIPQTIVTLQRAARDGRAMEHLKQYTAMVDDETTSAHPARHCWNLCLTRARRVSHWKRWNLWTEIVKRFKTGAMSYGSISQEAHECMADRHEPSGRQIQLRRGRRDAGALSDTRAQFQRIKQVASGRFGVTSEYLVSAEGNPDQNGAGRKARRGRTSARRARCIRGSPRPGTPPRASA